LSGFAASGFAASGFAGSAFAGGCGEVGDCGKATAGARKAASPAAKNHLRIKEDLQRERAHYPTGRPLQCGHMAVPHGEMMALLAASDRSRAASFGALQPLAKPPLSPAESKKIRAKGLISLPFATEIQPEQPEAAKSPIISGI
jgi:hypothetical protein